MEQKRRGRPAKIKPAPVILEVESGEGTTIDQLKICGEKLEEIEKVLARNPYRVDIRADKQKLIDQICFLVKSI
jgi:hypothetical protein